MSWVLWSSLYFFIGFCIQLIVGMMFLSDIYEIIRKKPEKDISFELDEYFTKNTQTFWVSSAVAIFIWPIIFILIPIYLFDRSGYDLIGKIKFRERLIRQIKKFHKHRHPEDYL